MSHIATHLSNADITARPSSTTLILSSAEKWRRVLQRMSFFYTCSALALHFEGLGLIFVPSPL